MSDREQPMTAQRMRDIRLAHQRERAAAWREELARKQQAAAIRSERLNRYRQASAWLTNRLDSLQTYGGAKRQVELVTWMCEHFRRLAEEEDAIVQLKEHSK